MAVSTTPPIPPSQPDIAKLNTFTGYTVTVTQHTAVRGSVGRSVVSPQQMKLQQILDLQATLPLTHGPGFYRFTVVDTGGTGENEWFVKLGPDLPEAQMAGPTGIGSPPINAGTVSEGVRALGHGFFYDESIGLLTTPWRQVVSWKQGDPLPIPPPTAQQAQQPQQFQMPPTGSWPQSSWAGPGGWGGGAGAWAPWGTIPATDDSTKMQLDATTKRLEESERRAEQERRDRDARERDEKLREEMRRDREDSAARFEKLITTVTSLAAKPQGPDENVLRMERQLAEEKRQREESEREAKRREEMRTAEERRLADQRIADDRHREEMRLMREEIKSATANRTDPMMTLFGQILATQSAGAAQTVQMVRDTATSATAAAERSATQILELARTQRDGSVEASRGMIDGMKNLMDTQSEVYKGLLEMRGGDSPPWYADIAREALGQASQVGQAIAAARAQQTQQPQYMPPAPQQRPAQPRRQPQPVPPSVAAARTVPATQPIPQVGAAPPGVQVHTGDRPAGTSHDKATDEFVLANGARVKADIVREKGWAMALNEIQQHAGNRAAADAALAATAPPAPVPINGTNGTHGTNGTVHAAPVALSGRRKMKRKAARRGRSAAVPITNPHVTIEQLRDMPADQVREATAMSSDTEFFGVLMPSVQELRVAAANGRDAEQVANAVLQARQYFATLGTPPPAVELLYAEHIEVLVERLLPDAHDDYREQVVDAMQSTIDEENGRGGEDEEGDEPDEVGAEA